MGDIIAFPAIIEQRFEYDLQLAAGAEYLAVHSPAVWVEPEPVLATVTRLPLAMPLDLGTPNENGFYKELSLQNESSFTALPLSEVIPEQEVQLKAAEFIGSVILTGAISVENVAIKRPYTLSNAISEAATGSKEAASMVEQNVASDVVERTLKSGHITKVELEVTEDNTIIQHGQTDADIQSNSLRYGSKNQVMGNRNKAESRNMFRRREAYRQGYLEEYVEVVFSLTDTELSEDELSEVGFFTNTMSCAIQATACEDDSLTLESAFVSGKKARGSRRHDIDTIYNLGDILGVSFRGMSATEILDTPILIPKKLMPNGVVDIVKLYDECAGGTFFGEDKPQQDYIAYKELCAKREEAFQPRVKAITSKLIAEASNLKDPIVASKRLNKLSAEEMLEQCVVDASIDPRVFGVESAYRIEHARFLVANGQLEMSNIVIRQAKALDRSSSCPGGSDGQLDSGLRADGSDDKATESLEDCEFVSKECPVCHKKNVKTVVKNGKYYGDCGCSA